MSRMNCHQPTITLIGLLREQAAPSLLGKALRAEHRSIRRMSVSMIVLMVLMRILLSASTVQACDGVSDHAYHIVVAAAIDAMPDELRSFLDPHREHLGQASLDPDRNRPPSKRILADDAHHFWLDIASSDRAGATQQSAGATDFPRTRAEAEALCRRMNRESCGTLPWAVESQFRNLVVAFQDGQSQKVLNALPPLFHLAADAAMPLNVTAEAGRGSPQRSRSSRVSSQAAAVDRLHERLAYEVRIWPERVTPITEPIDEVFDLLIGSYEALESLHTIEASATRSRRQRAAPASQRETSADDQWAGLFEDRLEAGALFAARLVAAAWDRAGRPELAISESGAERTVIATSPDDETSGFAGSRDSTVFHRITCSHVARIKPENLVRFDSLKEAQATGRKPCRSCKPDAAE